MQPISLSHLPTLWSSLRALAIIGLSVIAFGTGGIKPCVSAFGGEQFKDGQVRQITCGLLHSLLICCAIIIIIIITMIHQVFAYVMCLLVVSLTEFEGEIITHLQSDLLRRFFSIFYFSINAGSFLSIVLTPILRSINRHSSYTEIFLRLQWLESFSYCTCIM